MEAQNRVTSIIMERSAMTVNHTKTTDFKSRSSAERSLLQLEHRLAMSVGIIEGAGRVKVTCSLPSYCIAIDRVAMMQENELDRKNKRIGRNKSDKPL